MRSGARKEPRVSGIGVFEKGWPFKKATLYIYVEGSPSLAPELLAQASQDANRQWQQSRLSTTAALQESVGAGMRALSRQGGAGASGAGITCAVLQEDSVYLAQAGSTRAYVLGPLVCRRIASSSPWDANHVDVREEPLAQASVLLLAPSILEEALPLLQGGLPPKEVHRLIKAWLQDQPQLSALVVGIESGRQVALAVGSQAPAEEEPPPPPNQPHAGPRFSAQGAGSGAPASERLRGGGEFRVLRALRLPLAVVAALLALLVLGGVAWYIPGHQKGEDETRLSELIDKAGSTLAEANRYSDPALARGMLAQAGALAKDASGIRPKDKRVTALQQEITDSLDRVNSVIRPGEVSMLADLAKEGTNQSSPTRVLVERNNLYVMDRGAGRVYKFLLDQGGRSVLNTSNKVLARKGDDHAGASLGDLWDAIWIPPGPLRPTGSVLILDAKGMVLDYRPERGIQVLPLRGFQGWSSFKGARGYSGNLYILDAAARQIWRYIPTSNGYDSEARGILEDADIGDGVDLAIDGDIYVLSSRGAVLKFGGGAPKAFVQDKMDRPLTSPASIFTNPSTGLVYVADTGNGRIVAFDKEGRFRFQVQADALTGIHGLSVDEAGGHIYFTSGQKLYVATVPIPKL